jgi:phospholipase/carboxylesterase
MKAETIEGKALSYILVRPDSFQADGSHPLVILLHGFGASMHDLANLAPVIDASGYVYAFPNAPYRVDLGPGSVGYSWVLGRPGVEAPPLPGPSVEELLGSLIDELRQTMGVRDGAIILGGFSQGGGLSLRYGLPKPDVFAGIAVLSGFFRDADEIKANLPQDRDQAVFVVHGLQDPIVNVELGRQTRAFLEDAGYKPDYHEYDMAHQITPEVIRDLRVWLHETLPPQTAADAIQG